MGNAFANKQKEVPLYFACFNLSCLISAGSFWLGKTLVSISYLISEPTNFKLNCFTDMKELEVLRNDSEVELFHKLPSFVWIW